jgi:hypothetical protein
MSDPKYRLPALWLLLVVLPLMGVSCETDKRPPEKVIPPLNLKKATTQEILNRLESAQPPHWIRDGEQHREMLLIELIRRGGPDAEGGLKRLLERRQARWDDAKQKLKGLNFENDRKAHDEQELIVRSTSQNLELLTTLRRLQERADPLLVEVKTVRNVEAWQQETLWDRPLRPGPDVRKKIETALAKAKDDL